MSAPVLVLSDVTREHVQGEMTVHALRGVNLAVHAGELVAVMGPSGSGKSTLLHAAGGLDTPTSGQVFVEGVDLAGRSAAATAAVRRVAVSPAVLGYVVDVVRATRATPSLSLGVSPRGATALLATSRPWAWLSGRDYVTPDDVKALARPVLRHRVAVRPEAELEGVTAEGVLDQVLATVPVPR